ncbi:LysR family transcriptional regulator [Methylobacterium currus]|uniref:LysR family transcriptional regulator n=1 Tax=Methylobacterium currus TaxID=2051553 RepID=UPI001E4193FC|nr:LysR family transcriptional regulator [Methylobacterium currus]UHC16273.1 LysR family transcriptional regulator [Methylobacterium currus]
MPETRNRLPQLGSLRAFEAAARHGSLVAAAAELHVTHGAVSKQIRNLEAELGEPLFERRNRGLFLTERGRWLAERLSTTFAQLEDALADFARREADPPLVVSCEPTLCLRLLIPSLPALRAEAGLDIRVLAAGGRIDLRRDRVDLAIRRDDFPIPGHLAVRPLADEAMGPVCAPALAGTAGLPILHTRSRPDAWPAWRRRGLPAFLGSRDVQFEHFALMLEAAIAGQGIALASLHMVADDLKAGRLTALHPFQPDGSRYVALTDKPISAEGRERRFAEWIGGRMARTLADPPGGFIPAR